VQDAWYENVLPDYSSAILCFPGAFPPSVRPPTKGTEERRLQIRLYESSFIFHKVYIWNLPSFFPLSWGFYPAFCSAEFCFVRWRLSFL